MQDFVISTNKVEQITGIDFFPILPYNFENEIESEFDLSKWKFKAVKKLNFKYYFK